MLLDAGMIFGACVAALFALAGAMTHFARKARANVRAEWQDAVRAQEVGPVDRAVWGVIPNRDWLNDEGVRSARVVDVLIWFMLVATVGLFLVAAIATRKVERWFPCEAVFRLGCTPKAVN